MTQAEVSGARPRNGDVGTWRWLLDSFFRRCPEIRYGEPNHSEFDAVVLVSPIWAYRLAGAMRSFVVAQRASLRDVAVISVMGESGAPKSRLIGRPPLMNAAFKTRAVEDGSCAARLQACGKAVQEAKDSSLVGSPVHVVAAGRVSQFGICARSRVIARHQRLSTATVP